MDAKELEKLFKKISCFDKHMGMSFTVEGPGKVTYKMEITENHLSSPKTAHGGVIAGMMDNVLGVTALSYAVTQDKLCSTVEFKINYINPAHPGDLLIGTADIDFKGKSLVVTSATIRADKRLIAKGMGTFNLYPMEKHAFFGFESQENPSSD